MKAAFFGTPELAVPALAALIDSRHQVVGVVTAPDRPRGRGMRLQPSPVKEAAVGAGIPVLQPPSLRPPEVRAELAMLGADVFVVVAFGLILPPAVLDTPAYGCLNVHFSLLPLFRGAAPVHWALIEGHDKTGVTIMQMDPGLDTGPILAVAEEEITVDDTAGTLGERLAVVGAELLLDVLARLERSDVVPQPQDDALASLAPKLSSSDAHIVWANPASQIANRIRAFTPRPGAWGMLGPRRLKILRAHISDQASTGAPGTLHVDSSEALEVDTLTNRVGLDVVQPEGKSQMTAAEFIRGYRPRPGDVIN